MENEYFHVLFCGSSVIFCKDKKRRLWVRKGKGCAVNSIFSHNKININKCLHFSSVANRNIYKLYTK